MTHPIPPECRRMAEIPCLVPQATGLVSARDRRGPRRLRGLRQPLAGRTPGTAAPRRSGRDPRRGRRRGPPPHRSVRSPSSSGTGRRPTASAGKSGPAPASPRSSSGSSASATTRAMSAGCSRSWAGRRSSRSGGPSSGTTRRIRRWRDETWPGLRRRARRERRALVFEDESGFYLLPGAVKTYAPEGLTPVLREKQTRDHLSVMGAMTPAGPGLHPGPAGVAQRAALHRVPPAPAPRRGGSRAGDLGRLADPSAGGGQGVRVEDARPGVAGGPAGVCPGPEPLGRGRLAPPEGRRDAESGVPGSGRIAPGTRPRRRATATETSSGPILLCTGRIGNLSSSQNPRPRPLVLKFGT